MTSSLPGVGQGGGWMDGNWLNDFPASKLKKKKIETNSSKANRSHLVSFCEFLRTGTLPQSFHLLKLWRGNLIALSVSQSPCSLLRIYWPVVACQDKVVIVRNASFGLSNLSEMRKIYRAENHFACLQNPSWAIPNIVLCTKSVGVSNTEGAVFVPTITSSQWPWWKDEIDPRCAITAVVLSVSIYWVAPGEVRREQRWGDSFLSLSCCRKV